MGSPAGAGEPHAPVHPPRQQHRSIPAGAGIDRLELVNPANGHRFPRRRGDRPLVNRSDGFSL